MSFRRYAKASGIDLTVLNTQALVKSAAVHDFEIKPGYLYTRVRAISARVNRNFDGFPSEELKKSYGSFLGRPVFVNHVNSDHRRTRGVIVSSQYIENGKDKYIELVNKIDAKSFPRLAKEIMSGNIDSVSMGCDVQLSKCSYCGNEATEMDDFCNHILQHKGQYLSNDEGVPTLVYESCHGLGFFEISYVFDPADETAVMQEVITPKTAITRDPTIETVSPANVDTLRSDDPCPNCAADDYDGTECKHCGHYSVAELEDPDTSKAKKNDTPSKKGKEGKSMTTRTSSKDVALERAQAARRRIREAQQRLADAPFPGTEEETIVGTPAPEAPVATTDEVRNQDDTTNVQDLDSQVGTDMSPDETTDVTVKDPIADVPAKAGDEADNIDNLGKKDASTVKEAKWSEYRALSHAAKLATNDANEEDTYNAHNFARHAHEAAAAAAPDKAHRDAHRAWAAGHSQAAMNRTNKSKRPDFVASITAADDGTGAHDGEGAPDSVADAAKPDARVDVTAPVADVNPAESQETQYNTDEYEDNGGDNIRHLDPSNTNIIPGQKASSLEVAMLVDQYVKQGLLDANDKFNKWAEFENLSAEIVKDRTALLSLVASRTPRRNDSIPTRTASASQPRVARSAPVLGRPTQRTATLTSEAELDQSDDSLTFL